MPNHKTQIHEKQTRIGLRRMHKKRRRLQKKFGRVWCWKKRRKKEKKNNFNEKVSKLCGVSEWRVETEHWIGQAMRSLPPQVSIEKCRLIKFRTVKWISVNFSFRSQFVELAMRARFRSSCSRDNEAEKVSRYWSYITSSSEQHNKVLSFVFFLSVKFTQTPAWGLSSLSSLVVAK